MTKLQAKSVALTALKVSASIVLFIGKAFLYLCLALYVVGELLFSELESVPAVEVPQPVRSIAKSVARPGAVKSVEVSDVVKESMVSDRSESIAVEADRSRYQVMTSPELRKECTAIGIKWRNANGSRHLSKAEMLAALAA